MMQQKTETMAIVYQHKRKDNGRVFYIGIGHEKNRAYQKKGRNYDWHKEIKLGNGFITEITHKDIVWEEACSIEKYLIAFYGRRDLGLGYLVNQTDGGDGTRFFGEKNGMYGKKHSKEAIEKCRLAAKNQIHTSETKIKISNATKGNKNPRALPVLQYTKKGEFVKEYSYIRLAKKETGANNISAVCKGKLKTSGGYFWKYK